MIIEGLLMTTLITVKRDILTHSQRLTSVVDVLPKLACSE